VTGFGLMGHGCEMIQASASGFRLRADAVPLLPGALGYAASGNFAGGMGRNKMYVEDCARDGRLALRIASRISPDLIGLLYDSETSGGLLFSAPAERAQEVSERFAAKDEPVWEIGEVIPERAIEIA